jgi:hypothetical protein
MWVHTVEMETVRESELLRDEGSTRGTGSGGVL